MGVAYVVLAHRGPAQVARLARRLLPGGHSVVVHVDARQDEAPFRAALAADPASAGVELVADRVPCRWGDASLVEAALRGARHALAQSPRATHVVLLSGQDYPLKPAAHVTDFFERHRGSSFMFAETEATPGPWDRTGNLRWCWNGRMDRLGRYHLRLGERWFALPNRFVPWWPMRSVPQGLRPVQGSQWWALHRPAAEHLVERFDADPRLRRFFAHVQIPDEFAPHMVIDASPFRDDLVHDDLHHITWEREHPKLLGTEDLPELLATPKLFARKFDEDASPAVLDALDRVLDGAGAP